MMIIIHENPIIGLQIEDCDAPRIGGEFLKMNGYWDILFDHLEP